MKIVVVGATGLVGQKMIQVLSERNFDMQSVIPVASARSAGKEINVGGLMKTVLSVEEAIELRPDIALFSAGGSASKEYAPRFAEVGTVVIDNSSAWRMDESVPLVVPEINADSIGSNRIIANPNCSTIQMVLALSNLHKNFGLKRLLISTYQSVSGTGYKALDQMEGERKGESVERVYPHAIDRNCLPHCDVFEENGYTKEEMKLVNETRKILGIPDLPVSATAVRVPVDGGHSESVNAEFDQIPDLEEVRKILNATPGVTVVDNPTNNEYPMPVTAKDRDDVFVGRIRKDLSNPQAINLWIVADNLRKGAATNAVQILESVLSGRKVNA
jgi:aspartate-semialdehyde dehydrogenase